MAALNDTVAQAASRGFSGGRQQIINGQSYAQYSPQWYDAMRANEVQKGTTLGQTTKAAYDAMGSPADTSSSSSSGSLAGLGGAAGLPPRIGSGGSGTGGGLPGYETFDSGGGGSPSPVPQISMPDRTAAESAAFGKAKDQIGQETAGALSGLRSVMASRGLLGGQGEYVGTQNVFTKGQGELGDTSRAQAEQSLADQMDIEKTNQGAALTGRGQDISAATSRRGQNMDYTLGGRGQDITQRGQDIQYAESQAQLEYTKNLQQAAQRQQILSGIMGAINGSTLY
jgi:hypothetical protein